MTAPAWAEQARVEAFQARYERPTWAWWLVLPALAWLVAGEELCRWAAARCRAAITELEVNR